MSHEHLASMANTLDRFSRMTKAEIVVLLCFAHAANHADGVTWIGDRKIAQMTGLYRGEVFRAKQGLIEKNLLQDRGIYKNCHRFFVNLEVPLVRGTTEVLSPSESPSECPSESPSECPSESPSECPSQTSALAGRTLDNQNQNMNKNPNRPAMGSSMLNDLVAECVDHDLYHRPPKKPAGDALRKSISDDYTPIVTEALRRRAELGLPPPETDDLRLDLREWSFSQRNNEPLPAGVERRLFPKPAKPPCARCDDRRWIEDPLDRNSVANCPDCFTHKTTGELT